MYEEWGEETDAARPQDLFLPLLCEFLTLKVLRRDVGCQRVSIDRSLRRLTIGPSSLLRTTSSCLSSACIVSSLLGRCRAR